MTKMKNEELKRSVEDAAKKTLVANEEMSKTLSTSIVLAKPTPNDSNDSEQENRLKAIEEYHRAVMDAYRKKYNKEPEKDKNGNDVLHFNSPEEATQFFRELANEKKPFFALEVDANGNPTGSYKMSYGDGELHEGKVNPNEINKLHSDFLNKMMAPKPTPEKTGNVDFKERMSKLKEGPNASPDVTPRPSTAPNPFDTGIPKPVPV